MRGLGRKIVLVDKDLKRSIAETNDLQHAIYYGIVSAIARIVDVILHDQRALLTVSTMTSLTGDVADVWIYLPNLIGGNGTFETLPLSNEESAGLSRNAEILKAKI
jgi:L-lactate dehydrogenase